MSDITIRRRQVADSSLPDSIHPILRRVYQARGITQPEQLDHSARFLLHVSELAGMEQAVALLSKAMANNQRITIVGDFDADGATSTALCVLALKRFGHHNVGYLVPNRFVTGYGLTPPIADQAAAMGTDLLVTVDNGVSAISGVARAKALGMQVLVTDHHLPGDELPAADAMVNPNLHHCEFPSKNLAGVGVAFYLMAALRQHLADQSWYQQQPINLAELLDIVAVGTVADVVSLDHNNRILVNQGLQRIRAGRCRPGILALAQVAKREPAKLQASDLGFAIGPRLNAAGRLDDMALGIECLLTDDWHQAQSMAQQLDELNLARRDIERGMEQEALQALDKLLAGADFEQLPPVICLYQADWHQGVIGILAARVKERFHRPVLAFAADDNGMLKGSARSVQGVHMRDMLAALDTKYPQLIERFGGHAMAAGLSIQDSQFQAFRDALNEVAADWITDDHLNHILLSDGELAAEDMNLPLAQTLRDAGPWGQSFPEPLFDGEFRLVQQRIVGERHLKMVLQPVGSEAVFDGIAFNIDTGLWPDESVQRVHVAYQLDINEFRGNTQVQLLVKAIKPMQ
ncbi:single-stranded-DNA-specific exonuclease RecJ [Neiella marina]|uniref:Single-stranded-DNA-specific exonuclease RecJ n=1 Tax=Neiella holothuriorum TaxID=2870530 RepID=A0ABS7EJ10_9GAMM|nr:single-stranded-DNA-specific exonuclease RecJ [Neiella holothuriorum]MBW8192339.1 single-stranded-DNA-specific exonuclease RecJ [Neiella holothuriorum]